MNFIVKKLFTFFALLVTIIVSNLTSAENAFNGFYLGVQTGYTQRDVTNKVVEDSVTVGYNGIGFINGSKTKNIKGLLYGLLGGWGKSTNDFYLGLEASLHYDNLNKTKQYSFYSPLDGSGPWPFQAQYKRGLVFGVGPRFGKIINESYLIYGKLGLELSRDRAMHMASSSSVASPPGAATASYSASPNFKSAARIKIVIVPAIGFEKSFEKFLTRLEYGFNPGATLRQERSYVQTQNAPPTNYNNTDRQTIKYKQHIIKFAAVYKF